MTTASPSQAALDVLENPACRLLFSQVGGFLLVNSNLVEKLSHIRGIQHGQIQMARIILNGAGDGDLGRMIENRPLGAVFEFLQRKGPEVGCRATS